ncbi:hypothetical protein FOC1_g10010435 [Fusarium oxysporum f. sp. cubense race 1]|uniref:Uncharacterized protein n=1 Tax=Fusarium oxysporum f. sp. cubense (strain race 1) TaxID=1229664 RepID=N4UY43_FUSC1|nr:hypothetical protein FOC1_g10010435 [Fusarium oxysporum f. sp. cubense race 1]
MPRRWFSDRLHHAWGRVAGRHVRQRDQGSQSPQHYAEIVAAPDQSPDRANHLRRGASLPDLLTRASLGVIAQPLPLDSQSLWDTPTPAPSPVQSQSNGAIGLAIITTRDTGSIGTGIEDQPWMLPGQDFFPESQPPVPSHLRTGLFLNSQPKHRTLEPCDCCSPKTLAGNWPTLTPDPLTHTFTRHESLASCSELRGRDHSKSQDKAFAVPISVITNQGMTRETKKLKRTIDRYIPLRMFHHNPHTPFTGALGDTHEIPCQALDALFSGAPRGSNNSRKPGTQDVPTTGALEAVQVSQHWALDALFTGGAREILDESVQDGFRTGVPEGSDYDQMRGDQDVPRIVPPVAVSDISASSERDIRRIRRETAVLPRVD